MGGYLEVNEFVMEQRASQNIYMKHIIFIKLTKLNIFLHTDIECECM